MLTHTGYRDALKAVEDHYGCVSDYVCVHCTAKASRWVVDKSVSATVDPKFRRYSDKPTDYWPFCARHAHDYDAYAGDWPPVIIRRVNTFTERHWYTDCFAVDPDGSVMLKDAYATYLDFCREEQMPLREVMTRSTFKAALMRHGASQKRTSSGVSMSGVKLRTN